MTSKCNFFFTFYNNGPYVRFNTKNISFARRNIEKYFNIFVLLIPLLEKEWRRNPHKLFLLFLQSFLDYVPS